MTTKLRFRRQDVRGLASYVRELHEARYGGLLFLVERRSNGCRAWPKARFVAFVTLGDSSDQPYWYKAKSIKDGKEWCRGALSYILRGIVPFGDHSEGETP